MQEGATKGRWRGGRRRHGSKPRRVNHIPLAEPSCVGCPLQEQSKVYPDGNRNAQIALVGEGPGWQETLDGAPFVGPSGKLLNWLLKRAHIRRSNVWVTNVALCQPTYVRIPDTDLEWSKTQAMKESCTKCTPRLLRELAVVKPKVIVAFGNEALAALTGERGVRAKHGALFRIDLLHRAGLREKRSVKEADVTYVMPAFHPAFCLREEKWTAAVEQVLHKARRIAEQGPRRDTGSFLLVSPFTPDADATIRQLEYRVDLVIEKGYDIAFDVETPRDPKGARAAEMTVFGFAVARWNLGIAVTIKAWNRATGTYVECWTPEQKARVLAAVQKLCLSPLRKWAQNAYYDINVCNNWLPQGICGPFEDTKHYHWLWQPDLAHGLGFIAQSLLDIEAWKEYFHAKEKDGTATHQDLLLYNAKDCLYTALIAPKLQAMVRHTGQQALIPYQWDVATKLANRAYLCGLLVDAAKWQERLDEFLGEAEGHRQTMIEQLEAAGGVAPLNDYVFAQRCAAAEVRALKDGKDYKQPKRQDLVTLQLFNPKSPHQAQYYLFEVLGLVPTVMTAGGEEGESSRPSITYKQFLGLIKDPAVKAYVKYAEARKRVETLQSIKAHCDPETLAEPYWKLHPSWNDTGIKNTRFTSSPNVQNLEKKLREVIVAGPGRKFVGADAAQIEYRVAAVFAGIQELLDLFNQEPFDEEAEPWKKFDPAYDAHSLVAVEVFGDGYLGASKSDKSALRTMVKRVVYGLFYGAMPEKIYTTILEDRRVSLELRAFITLELIEKVHNGFRSRFKEWEEWCDRELTLTTRRGYQQYAPFRRKRYWPVMEVEANKIRNTPIQGSAGDVCNYLFMRIQDRCDAEGLDADFVLHGHDAIYLNVAEEHAEQVKRLVNEEFHLWLTATGYYLTEAEAAAANDDAKVVHIYGQAGTGDNLAQVG